MVYGMEYMEYENSNHSTLRRAMVLPLFPIPYTIDHFNVVEV